MLKMTGVELDDIDMCLAKVKSKAAEKGIKLNGVLLMGGSAGAHLSMLYAYARKETAPLPPVAVCAYCPPVDCSKADFLKTLSVECISGI